MTGGVAWRQGWWWTVFTAIFLHGGLLHIFFNLMWIRNLGPAVAEVYGAARLSSSSRLGRDRVPGLEPGLERPVDRRLGEHLRTARSTHRLRTALGILADDRAALAVAIIVFAMGFFMSGVNNWAHGGGFAGGWIVAETMRSSGESRESPASRSWRSR